MTPARDPLEAGRIAACGCSVVAFGLGLFAGLVLAALLRW